MKPRWVPVLLALWYGAMSTPAPTVLAAQLLPAAKSAHAEDFPCARHDCGCNTAERCRLHCCCQLKGASTVPVSYWSAMECSGHAQYPGTVTAFTLGPHLPVRSIAMTAPVYRRRSPTRDSSLHPSVFRDAPDKIPI